MWEGEQSPTRWARVGRAWVGQDACPLHRSVPCSAVWGVCCAARKRPTHGRPTDVPREDRDPSCPATLLFGIATTRHKPAKPGKRLCLAAEYISSAVACTQWACGADIPRLSSSACAWTEWFGAPTLSLVFFGEALPIAALTQSVMDMPRCDLLLCVGSSFQVALPASRVPVTISGPLTLNREVPSVAIR